MLQLKVNFKSIVFYRKENEKRTTPSDKGQKGSMYQLLPSVIMIRKDFFLLFIGQKEESVFSRIPISNGFKSLDAGKKQEGLSKTSGSISS